MVSYPINFTTTGTYTLWLRGYPTNAAGDSVYVGLGDQVVEATGFAPDTWEWANERMASGQAVTLSVEASGVYTLSLWMREDGLRLDRLLLTTDTTYLPSGDGPAETARQVGGGGQITPLDHTIVYTYDDLYRLTGADYNTGESYGYSYDPVGNRLQQIINSNVISYTYDDANRLATLNGQSVYTFDNNGNLLETGVITNVFDAANRLTETAVSSQQLAVSYDGLGNRVAQTVGVSTTYFALDVASGLPEVIYTSEGNTYLHLPGVIVAESATGETRYLLSDGLGSIRQAVDDNGEVVSYHEFDPYGNPVSNNGGEPYGYTGEWWEGYNELLHLRARWLMPETGTFLSRDAVESEPPYQYVRGNPVNLADPSGFISECEGSKCKVELLTVPVRKIEFLGHYGIIHTDQNEKQRFLDALPEDTSVDWGGIILSGDTTDMGNPVFWDPKTHPFDGIAGIIQAHIVKDDEIAIQAVKEDSQTSVVVVAEGEAVCDKWDCLKSAMTQIEQNQIAYQLMGPNSNSAAISVLRHCGLSWFKPAIVLSLKTPWRAHPGWTLNLLSADANARQQ